MVENNSLVTANDPPGTILSDLRVPEDQSPWIVRHNFSYIRSEHPDREGANSYNLDRRGSFAFCAITRPFSNLNANGDRTFDWLKNDLERFLCPAIKINSRTHGHYVFAFFF